MTNIRNVIIPFKTYVKFRSLIKEFLSLTSAVDALMIMMIGASTRRAIEKAIPYAARLNFGSFNLAIMAARKGPSVAIMSQVAARGIQKINIFLGVNCCVFKVFIG